MKVAVIGSRGFDDYDKMSEYLSNMGFIVTLIVSGGARGADSLAERYAKEKNIKTRIFYPDWDKYGKSAGYIRNVSIVKEADVVVAFWDGRSKGTAHSMKLAQRKGKQLKLVMTER